MNSKMWTRRLRQSWLPVGLASAVLAGLYVVQLRNFLLFHSLVELFSIFIAFALFAIVWHAPVDIDVPYLGVLGVAYLFVGGIDLLHTLAYDGMGVFPNSGADLPTQLWLFARGLEAVSLIAAGIVGLVKVKSDVDDNYWGISLQNVLFVGYSVVVATGLASIFVFDIVPTAYEAGVGLTRFKVVSEYVIIGLLLVALGLLYRQRRQFDSAVYRYLLIAIVLTMGAELAFTFYVSVYGFSNAVGHFLKLGSFYLFYSAAVKMGLREPQRTLYRSLKGREQRFKRAAEAAGHAILITDTDGTIEYVNPAFEDVSGYTASEAIGRNPRILKSDEMTDEYYQELWETILAGDVWHGEIANQRKSGGIYWAKQTVAPIADASGQINGFVGILTDISPLKQREQQLQVLERVLRHNLRNEMTVIRGRAELIRWQVEATTATQVETILNKSDELIQLVETERLIAKALADEHQRIDIDVATAVSDAIETLHHEFPEANVELTCHDQPRAAVTRYFEQGIEELVRNAIVHNDLPRDEGLVAVTISLISGTIHIEVRDNGPAIPENERAVLLRDLLQTKTFHGSGLGLWFVRIVLNQLDGSISYTEGSPRGNVIEISFPESPESATDR